MTEICEVRIDMEKIIKKLNEKKAEIINKREEAVKLWESCVDAYADAIKKGLNISMPPEKPTKSRHMNRIDNYIDMLEVIIGEYIDIDINILKSIFVDISEAEYEIAECFLAMSDYSLSLKRATVER